MKCRQGTCFYHLHGSAATAQIFLSIQGVPGHYHMSWCTKVSIHTPGMKEQTRTPQLLNTQELIELQETQHFPPPARTFTKQRLSRHVKEVKTRAGFAALALPFGALQEGRETIRVLATL